LALLASLAVNDVVCVVLVTTDRKDRGMRNLTLAVVSVLLALAPHSARAAGTRIWEVRTATTLAEGELDGAIVTSRGEVRPGPRLERHEIKADAVWCMLGDPRGGVWLGTGSKGEVFRFAGGDDDKPERVAETGQTAVTVMRRDADANILVATIPEGKIFVIPHAGPPEDGKLAEWATVADAYVWDLLVEPGGVVWAATGPEGKLYRIEDGKVEEWYDSKEKNLLSLALGDGGEVYVGSGEKGFLYRVTEKGKARVVYDFDENEVRAIVPTNGGLLIAANAAKSKGAPPSKAPPKDAKPPENKKKPAPPPSKTPMNCAVYRLADDGSIETAFASKGEFIWGLASLDDGSFIAATAERGRVYRARLPAPGAGAGAEPLLLDGGADVLFDLEEGQALTLVTEMGKLAYVGTGNKAAVYSVGALGAREAVYTSKAFDAKFVSTWGRVEWDFTGDVGVDVRSGATAEPDETWSDWVEIDPANPAALAPRSRYAQFRARLAGEESALRAVRIAYLVDNQRPDIASVSAGAGAGGGANQKKSKGSTPTKAGPPSHSTVVNVKWEAKDPDGDALAFRVYYKPEGEGDTAWREMTKEAITASTFAWKTRGLPDGRYVVKVVASDNRANPEARSLAAARESDPVLVDHTAPTIADLRVANGQVTGIARDAASRISYLAYSVDGGKWKLIAPADGLLDGPEERFTFALPDDLEAGQHAIAVQAADAGGNLAAARERFDVR
jgi:hypothetical protein